MIIEKKEIEFPNITIKSVNVYKKDKKIILFDSDEFIKTPDNYSGLSVENIVLNEDMFNGPVSGIIVLNDSVGLLEQLNLSIYDSIEFNIFDNYTAGNFNFRILDYSVSDNLAKKEIHGPAGIKTTITIRFTSDFLMYRDYDIQSAMSNFIGKISKNKKSEEDDVSILGQQIYPNLVTIEEEEKMEGFVQSLFKSMAGDNTENKKQGEFGKNECFSFKPIEADDTHNDIWVKSNPTLYPFSKFSNNAKPLELMNYICEYACWKKDPNVVNFFFWEDLDKWNFKCIASLATKEIKAIYDLDEYEHFTTSIVSLNIINELRITDLVDKGCFFSEYIRTKPNWSNPYRHVIGTSNSLSKKNITFNYLEDIKKPTISQYSIVENEFLTNIRDNPLLNYSNNRITDSMFGYYSAPYNVDSSNFSWWNYYNFYSDGYTGDRMQRLEQIKNEEDILKPQKLENNAQETRKREDIAQISRLEKEFWQSQFDFCELPGAILRIIYKDIKYPLIEARYAYAKLKSIKNMWSVYKRNICCEREVPLNFFAVLTNAEKIYGATASSSFFRDSGGIYAYSWAEVEVWPKSYLQTTNVWDKTKKIIEFEDQNYPFVFVMPSHAFVGGASTEYTLKSDDPLNESKKGITGVVAGKYFTPDTRAYNINELLNSVPPINFEAGSTFKTLLMSPGISDVLGSLTSNRSNYTNYPTEIIMMPVGKFRIINDTCPDFSKSGTELPVNEFGTNSGGFYFGGRIVQMNAIPVETIQSFYSSSPRGLTAEEVYKFAHKGLTGLPYMFLFDVTNAHDGLCNSDNCT